MKNRVIVVAGPTASGKTACAVQLCKILGGEVVSADSMQIYDEMSIGTALPTDEEKQGIAHHMLAFIHPDTKYNASMYQKDALSAVNSIISKGKIPVIAGGTGLYVNSLTYRLDFTQTAANEELRAQLSDEYDKDPAAMYQSMLRLDPSAENRIHLHDKKRIIRRMEIHMQSGGGEYDFFKENDDFDFVLIGLTKQREKLYDDINARVDIMMGMGLEAEARRIYEKYGSCITAFSAIGYKEFLPYFYGECCLFDTVEKIKQNTRRFAKRQLTWFKRDKRFKWYFSDAYESVDALCQDIVKQSDLV